MKRLMLIAWLFSMAPLLAAMEDGKIAFSLPDTNGKTHALSHYTGKWVIVNYWATSCAACLEEIPELQAFHEQHKDHDAVVLGVDYENISLSWLKDFMDSVSMSYPVLRSEPSQITPFGIVIGLPTTFIVSPSGELLARQTGAVTAVDLEAFIKRNSQAVKATSATKLNTEIHSGRR